MAVDLFCCAGGSTRGLQRAGFYVIGMDVVRHKNYIGDEFFLGDALTRGLDVVEAVRPDLVTASPPCQRYTKAQKIQKNEHPDLIPPTRDMLVDLGIPYVIENVPGSPLNDPIELCGCMFPELNVYRTRLFETSFSVSQPKHGPHDERLTKMGRAPRQGERMHVVGNFSGVADARKAMDIDWMTRDQLREAIPPAYMEHIAQAFLEDHFA